MENKYLMYIHNYTCTTSTSASIEVACEQRGTRIKYFQGFSYKIAKQFVQNAGHIENKDNA